MASQDFLFAVMPRNSRVEVDSDTSRVSRVQKKPKSEAVSDEEGIDPTQNARVERRLQGKSKDQQQRAGQSAPESTASDKDAGSEADQQAKPEGKKGINLDLYV